MPFARGKAAKIVKGLGDVARLVYDDGIPVNKIVKSETLQKIFKQLNFSKVNKHSINRQIESEYQCARKFILEIDEEPGQEIESDDDEDESDTSNVNETTNIDLHVDVVKEAAKCVRDIKRSPKLQDKMAEAQRMMNRSVLKVVLDNATRWNSLLDMLLRFNEMKDVLVFITDDRLSNYNWEKSKKICFLSRFASYR